MLSFIPSRAAGMKRLADFVPEAAAQYAARRNLDPGPERPGGVSRLSPWVRRRLLLESELCAAVLAVHSYDRVDKFIQEVCWRTYWKGWLEQRPGVWRDYRANLSRLQAELPQHGDLRRRYRRALAAQTGIECFDAWVQELLDTGYLHNHSRMWFASIWIFTLQLPWELGADLFLRELLDGDPAANTLSWRWVAGLHTRGKHYLARAENIDRYTQHRFHPRSQLREDAPALPACEESPRLPLNLPEAPDWRQPCVLLVHEDDLHAESLAPPEAGLRGVAILAPDETGFADARAERVRAYARGAAEDTQARLQRLGIAAEILAPGAIPRWARQQGARSVVSAYAPCGTEAERLIAMRDQALREGLEWSIALRDWDRAFWPHATRGFFQVRDRIPDLLHALGIA